MKRQLLTGLLGLLLIQLAAPASAQLARSADYYRYMRIAERARQAGDFDTALINYGRAIRQSHRDPDATEGVNRPVEERLQRMEADHPDYVRYVRVGNASIFNRDCDTAIINFRRALAEQPGDYYAGIRLQQAECIKTKNPGTLAQCEWICPSLFPSDGQ